MAKVSVIVPIYGVEKYLKEAIDSILNQTLTDLEIILIDDGGKDSCPQLIDEYSKKDSRIIAIHKQNGGYGQTCNVGLSKATGEYIAIMEPDDYIEHNMYEDLYNIAKQYDSDIVKSCFYDNLQFSEKEKISKANWNNFIPEDKSFTIKEYPFFLYYHPSIWSCIYKKEFLDKYQIRFVEAAGAGWTDNPFQVQTMCLAKRINYTSKAYYYWRRLNLYESDDLKDYTLPFKRSDEIHKWLKEQNITDENILANLYKREIAYVNIVLGKKEIENKQDCFEKIKAMLDRMDEKVVSNLKIKDKKFKKEYEQIRNNPNNFHAKLRIKRLRKELLCLIKSIFLNNIKKLKNIAKFFYSKKYKDNNIIYILFGFKYKFKRKYAYQITGENNNIYIIDNNISKRYENTNKIEGLEITIEGKNNTIIIDKNNIFKNSKISIKGDNANIAIQKTKYIIKELKIYCVFANFQSVNIGKDFSCEDVIMHLLEDNSTIQIGENCMCSCNIKFYPTDCHSIISTKNGKIINKQKPILINDNVWICDSVIVLKGFKCAPNTVLGAGCIASGEYNTENVIIAGNPSKIVKENIKWDRLNARKLEELHNEN